MASSSAVERKRFARYFKTYITNTAPVSVLAQQAITAKSAAPTGSSPSSKAQKTIETRKGIHGTKTMTDSGVQKIKDAGKQRTQSQPQN